MLDVLFCPELLGLICQNCTPHTLSQLSLTNRTISCSALEELWSSIENFGPLIRCMPQDLWVEHIPEPMSRTHSLVRLIHNSFIYIDSLYRFQSFRRPVRDTDYQRFLLRAALVRTIGFSSGTTSYDVDPDALLALCIAAPDIKLLPRLQKLDATLLRPDPVDCPGLLSLHRLLSPTITHVDIKEDSDYLILTAVAYECPSVVQVRLLCAGQSMPHSIPVLHRWSNLQILVVRLTHPMVLFAAASLPALKEFEASYIDYNPLEPIPKMPKGFSVLERLFISHCNYEFTIELMRYMDRSPIETIVIGFRKRIPLDFWLDLLTVLKDGVIHDRVKSIFLHCQHGQRFNQSFTVETISPLLCYTNLSVIHLQSLHGFNFDDNLIEAMASSWKELEALHLEMEWHPPARATFKSLLSIARHNKRLEKLTILFDASTITNDILKLRPWKGLCNQSLRILAVLSSPIENPDIVADFLADIFPNLDQIDCSADLEERAYAAQDGDSLSQVRCARWTEVDRLLQANVK